MDPCKCCTIVKTWVSSSQTAVAMLVVQLIGTGMQLLSKVILNNGTFVLALMTYRNIVAALCLLPVACFFERDVKRNMITWKVLICLFLNSTIGITGAFTLYYYGLRATKASYAVNFINLIPIVTFFLSIALRIETLKLRTKAGRIKTVGAVICLAGILVSGTYKGRSFYIRQHSTHQIEASAITNGDLIVGSCMLTGCCLCYAFWFILQVKVHDLLPYKYWATIITCSFGSIQSAIIGVCMDRKKESWKLNWDLQLITILYSGILASAVLFCLITSAVVKKGPTYPSMFNPLLMIFVVILEAVILGSAITLGALIGMVIIIIGLYAFFIGINKQIADAVPERNADNVENGV